MYMSDVIKLFHRDVLTHQCTDLLNQVGGMCSIYMAAHHLASGIGEKLQHTLRLVHRHGLAVGTIVMLYAAIISTFSLEGILRLAHAGSLRQCEYRCRHHIEADIVATAYDSVHGPLALHLCCMGKHLSAVNVANGIHVLYRGEHIVVNGNSLGIVFYSHLIKTESISKRFSANGKQDLVGLHLCHLALALKGNLSGNRSLEGRLHIEGNASLLKTFAQAFGDIAVDWRQTFLEEFHYCYLTAERIEYACKLHSYHSGTNYADALRQHVGVEKPVGVAHHLFVKIWDRQRL